MSPTHQPAPAVQPQINGVDHQSKLPMRQEAQSPPTAYDFFYPGTRAAERTGCWIEPTSFPPILPKYSWGAIWTSLQRECNQRFETLYQLELSLPHKGCCQSPLERHAR